MRISRVILLLVSLFLVLTAPWGARDAFAIQEGKTAQGESYVSGGVARGESATLDQRRADFSLRVVTAAKKTGSYLADAQVKITDASGNTVIDTKLDGPLLLVNLKLGRYTVETRFDQQIQRKTTTIHKGDHHEMLFYFDVVVETLPKGEMG